MVTTLVRFLDCPDDAPQAAISFRRFSNRSPRAYASPPRARSDIPRRADGRQFREALLLSGRGVLSERIDAARDLVDANVVDALACLRQRHVARTAEPHEAGFAVEREAVNPTLRVGALHLQVQAW